MTAAYPPGYGSCPFDVANAVAGGRVAPVKDSPRYSIRMGAGKVYKAGTVVLLASGERKAESAVRSRLDGPAPEVSIFDGRLRAARGGYLFHVMDTIAAREPLSAGRVMVSSAPASPARTGVPLSSTQSCD